MTKKETLLTEELLAKRLTKETSEKISARFVADIRKLELIPDFEVIGKGLGKGLGRTNSGWLNEKPIVDQALCVLRLRKLYSNLGDLYHPLWAMGYPIPNQVEYDELRYPIDWFIEDLNQMSLDAGSRFNVGGDLVSDVVSDAVFEMEPFFNAISLLGGNPAPPDSIEVGINLLVNPNYDLNSQESIEGLEQYEDWKRETRARNVSSLEGSGEIIDFVFRHAPFLKEHLSLHKLQKAMDECTDEILDEVQLDIGALREIVTIFSEFVQVLTKDLSDEFKPESADDSLPQLFTMAKIFAMIDISLRVHGHGDLINRLRMEIPAKIRADFNPEVLKQIAALSPEFAVAMKAEIFKLRDSFQTLALRK